MSRSLSYRLLNSYLSTSSQSPCESLFPQQQSSLTLQGNVWAPLDCSLVLPQPTLPPPHPVERACVKSEREKQAKVLPIALAPSISSVLKCLFPSLLCSKPFWRLPAVPHVSSVSLLTRVMHTINKGLCIRTFKKHRNPQNSQIKGCSTWPWEKKLHPKHCLWTIVAVKGNTCLSEFIFSYS